MTPLASNFLMPGATFLVELAQLRDTGVLTDAEFQQQKARLLR
jgi:hypothetical protein